MQLNMKSPHLGFHLFSPEKNREAPSAIPPRIDSVHIPGVITIYTPEPRTTQSEGAQQQVDPIYTPRSTERSEQGHLLVKLVLCRFHNEVSDEWETSQADFSKR